MPLGMTTCDTVTSLNKGHHSFAVKQVGRWRISGQVWSLSHSSVVTRAVSAVKKKAICTHSGSFRLYCISPHEKCDRDRRWRSMIYDAVHRFCNKYITKGLLRKLRASQKSCSHSKDAVLAGRKAYEHVYNACGYTGKLAGRLCSL